MARDPGLEEIINDDLASVRGITQKGMFGGWVWLLNGNLLCGARQDGMLVRVGKDNAAAALEIPGVIPMFSGKRQMRGWVRAEPDTFGDDRLRAKLMKAALAFTLSLPEK
jgi:hypothetical protein